MWRHGRIIDYFFKRRTKRPVLRAKFARRTEVNSDRSDIRMLEPGIPVERYGDYQQSTGNTAQEAESERLISVSKSKRLFIEKSAWDEFGDRKQQPSGESVVFLSNDGTAVYKVHNPFAKSVIKQMHAQDAIYEHLIHNILFPSTRYQFVGISEDVDGVRIILKQSYISKSFVLASRSDIDRYLVDSLGLKIEDRYFYGNDYISVTDVSFNSDNVLTDGENLFFIDPIIKLKRPALEVLDYYDTKLSD